MPESAVLDSADLGFAYLKGAKLHRANLRGANLEGAVMPDGRVFEEYIEDPLAGICDEPEARERAVAAWGNHSWSDCPMNAAFGWNQVDDAPVDKRMYVAAFVALFDGRQIPKPTKQGENEDGNE